MRQLVDMDKAMKKLTITLMIFLLSGNVWAEKITFSCVYSDDYRPGTRNLTIVVNTFWKRISLEDSFGTYKYWYKEDGEDYVFNERYGVYRFNRVSQVLRMNARDTGGGAFSWSASCSKP